MKRFHLTIVTPQEVYFQGAVSSLIVPGGAGSFGVLADHAPIISTLSEGVLTAVGDPTLTDEEAKQIYQIGPGFIDVLNNRVLLLTNTIKKVGTSTAVGTPTAKGVSP